MNSKEQNLITVAFYNIENLFDTVDDPLTHDNDFLPTSDKRWTLKRYKKKLRKIGFVINNIGRKETQTHPLFIGLAEVENAKVIEDLLASKHLKDLSYNYVHYNSPDERGIDVAFLYDANLFTVTHSEAIAINLNKNVSGLDFTRDVLLVSGTYKNNPIHVFVNHWPSRRDGVTETEIKRLEASKTIQKKIELLRANNKTANIIVMGDFNDDPKSKSIVALEKIGLYNPIKTIKNYNRGTSNHKFKWNLFDQILFSTNFINRSHPLEFATANIFDESFLKIFKGKFKGLPFRTYVGKKYKGGFSDHFPVYVTFKVN